MPVFQKEGDAFVRLIRKRPEKNWRPTRGMRAMERKGRRQISGHMGLYYEKAASMRQKPKPAAEWNSGTPGKIGDNIKP